METLLSAGERPGLSLVGRGWQMLAGPRYCAAAGLSIPIVFVSIISRIG
ncbi:hypothetical protein LCM17_12830 [Cereibacter sphaeroides]|nr:hypothetical protein [Cereibacter sphaeroides]